MTNKVYDFRYPMKFVDFKRLREQAYKLVGEVGYAGEYSRRFETAYARGSEMLDEIDNLGAELGYLNAETNDWVPQ